MTAEEAAAHLNLVLSSEKDLEAIDAYGANIQAATFRAVAGDLRTVLLKTPDGDEKARSVLQIFIEHLSRAADQVELAGKPLRQIHTPEPS